MYLTPGVRFCAHYVKFSKCYGYVKPRTFQLENNVGRTYIILWAEGSPVSWNYASEQVKCKKNLGCSSVLGRHSTIKFILL